MKIENEYILKNILTNGINIFAGAGFSRLCKHNENCLPTENELLEEVKRKFWDFGVVALYAGIIAMVAPHTRFKFPCHNWYLAFAFWFFSGWDKLVNFYKEYPEASA